MTIWYRIIRALFTIATLVTLFLFLLDNTNELRMLGVFFLICASSMWLYESALDGTL